MRKASMFICSLMMCLMLCALPIDPSKVVGMVGASADNTASSEASSTSIVQTADAITGTYVIDEYGLFSESEYYELASDAQQMSEVYGIGTYLLVVDDIGSQSAREYAKNYYSQHNLGLGTEKSGILLLVAVDSRDYVFITYGRGVNEFSDNRIDEMDDDVKSYLSKNEWMNAAHVYYLDCDESYAYYEENGEPINNGSRYASSSSSNSGVDTVTLATCLIIVIIIAFVIARAIVKGEIRSMRTAQLAHEAGNYLNNETFQLTKSEDQFITTTRTVTKHPKPEHGDGGRFGGGLGGDGFSSIDFGGFGGSGGGKF